MSSKIKYKTSSQDDWLANNEFSTWLQKTGGNVYCGKCRVYSKTMQKVPNFESVCQNLAVQPFHFQVQVKHHNSGSLNFEANRHCSLLQRLK